MTATGGLFLLPVSVLTRGLFHGQIFEPKYGMQKSANARKKDSQS